MVLLKFEAKVPNYKCFEIITSTFRYTIIVWIHLSICVQQILLLDSLCYPAVLWLLWLFLTAWFLVTGSAMFFVFSLIAARLCDKS